MKRFSRTDRGPSRLSDSLHHQLNMYAMAATAAGVGLFAFSQAAEAKIIYTKAHHPVNPNTLVKLDLNHDGITDFVLKDTHSSNSTNAWGTLSALPFEQGNQVWGHTTSRRGYASALYAGVRIGSKGQFLPATGMMAATIFSGGFASCSGPWGNVKKRYLGLKFYIKGEVHFGWARLNVSCPWDTFAVVGLLTGYAYETVPYRSIVTGKTEESEGSGNAEQQAMPAMVDPGSLGRLAQGAGGSQDQRAK